MVRRKVRNILISLLSLMILFGCSKIEERTGKKNKVVLNHEEIMTGDFSSISGEYINSEGNVIFLEDDMKERMLDKAIYTTEGVYYFNIKTEDGLFGIGLFIFDAGIEIPNCEGLTDVTKVRIGYGHDYPRLIEEIYAKK